jgi:hypothetical protein
LGSGSGVGAGAGTGAGSGAGASSDRIICLADFPVHGVTGLAASTTAAKEVTISTKTNVARIFPMLKFPQQYLI